MGEHDQGPVPVGWHLDAVSGAVSADPGPDLRELTAAVGDRAERAGVDRAVELAGRVGDLHARHHGGRRSDEEGADAGEGDDDAAGLTGSLHWHTSAERAAPLPRDITTDAHLGSRCRLAA